MFRMGSELDGDYVGLPVIGFKVADPVMLDLAPEPNAPVEDDVTISRAD